MITNKDIQKLKQVFATKEDLEKFATKEDLERFATKDDFEYLKVKVNSIESKVFEIDEKVTVIGKRDIEDSGAMSKLILSHDRRMAKIEKILKLQNAA